MPRKFDVPNKYSHAGLCYDAAAPVSLADGKIPDEHKRIWLDAIASIPMPEGYAAWFTQHWRKTLEQDCFVLECVAASRLLVGSGNASGSDIGLHLHHTWGVPMVPGFMDYKRKVVGLGPAMIPSGDYDKDLATLAAFYAPVTPKHPELKTIL